MRFMSRRPKSEPQVRRSRSSRSGS
jgi:hypothetical protein